MIRGGFYVVLLYSARYQMMTMTQNTLRAATRSARNDNTKTETAR